MKIHREVINLSSNGERPVFHRLTDSVNEIVVRSGVKDGICVVYSHHTTCSVMIQERSFDTDSAGLEFMEKDLLSVFDGIIPPCDQGGHYVHPGPQAIAFAAENGENEREAHNTDAHLRSAFIGRSETIVIADGKLDLGSFGHIFFVDFDQTRPRKRQTQIMIMGE